MGESVVAGINFVEPVCNRQPNGLAIREPVGFSGLEFGQGEQNLPDVAISKTGIPIRLTDERWTHIAGEHSELTGLRHEVLETVSSPAVIYSGRAGELLAVREFEDGKWLVVVYRELMQDGFVITAFLTRRIVAVERRERIWP